MIRIAVEVVRAEVLAIGISMVGKLTNSVEDTIVELDLANTSEIVESVFLFKVFMFLHIVIHINLETFYCVFIIMFLFSCFNSSISSSFALLITNLGHYSSLDNQLKFKQKILID